MVRVPSRERAKHSVTSPPPGVASQTRQQAVAPANNSGQFSEVTTLEEVVQLSPGAGVSSPATRSSEEAVRGWTISFIYTNHQAGGRAGGLQQQRSARPISSAPRL